MKRAFAMSLLVCCLAISAGFATRARQTLSVPDDFETIQAAIDAARPGDTVVVRSGQYVESLMITKPLHVMGEHGLGVVLQPADPQENGIVVKIDSGQVVIQRVCVTGAEWGLLAQLGPLAKLFVLDSSVLACKGGIQAVGSGSVGIEHSYLIDNEFAGAVLGTPAASVEECEIVWGQYGIISGDVSQLAVHRSAIALSETAIAAYTTECGFAGGSDNFAGDVSGSGNMLAPVRLSCPSELLPSGFHDKEWLRAIAAATISFAKAGDLEEQGHISQALGALEMGLDVLEDHPFPVLQAHMEYAVADHMMHLARYEDVLTSSTSAYISFAARGMASYAAEARYLRGQAYVGIGLLDDALTEYLAARDAFRELHDETGYADVARSMGVLYIARGQYDEAVQSMLEAQRILLTQEPTSDEDLAVVAASLGAAYVPLERYEDALLQLRSARETYVHLKRDDDVLSIDLNIALIHILLGQHETALGICEDIQDRLAAGGAWEEGERVILEVGLANRMGDCLHALGRTAEAVDAYVDAIAGVESIRANMRSENLKISWGEQVKLHYERLIDLLNQMGKGHAAFVYSERCRARTFLDMLYAENLIPDQVISEDAGISTGAVDPEAIDDAITAAQKSLRPNEAVLEYMVTDGGVYLWVITSSDGVSDPIYVEYSRERLLRDVVALRRAIEPQKVETDGTAELMLGDPTDALEAFYDLLLKPALVPLDEEIDTVIFIPSGPLWYVPFAALAMTDRPEIRVGGSSVAPETRPTYLVEEYTLAFLPSLASLPMLSERTATSSSGYLAFANPTLSEEQQTAVGAHYQHGVLETACRTFASLVGGDEADVHVKAEASEALAHSTSTGQRVLMYACHGDFNPTVPLASRLLLAPCEEASTHSTDDRRLPDGDYHASEVLLTDHTGVELVVLAACETLLPTLREIEGVLGLTLGPESDDELSYEQLELIVAGDEVVGLSRAFLSSGAKSVLGTLWQASPTAIEHLLVSLGEHSQGGLSWAEALRQAQRVLISDASYDDVWFWAPYQLIGRWR